MVKKGGMDGKRYTTEEVLDGVVEMLEKDIKGLNMWN